MVASDLSRQEKQHRQDDAVRVMFLTPVQLNIKAHRLHRELSKWCGDIWVRCFYCVPAKPLTARSCFWSLILYVKPEDTSAATGRLAD